MNTSAETAAAKAYPRLSLNAVNSDEKVREAFIAGAIWQQARDVHTANAYDNATGREIASIIRHDADRTSSGVGGRPE